MRLMLMNLEHYSCLHGQSHKEGEHVTEALACALQQVLDLPKPHSHGRLEAVIRACVILDLLVATGVWACWVVAHPPGARTVRRLISSTLFHSTIPHPIPANNDKGQLSVDAYRRSGTLSTFLEYPR